MATSQTTINFILDQLRNAGRVAARKKFVGKYYQEGCAYTGAKPSMMIDGDRIEDDEWLTELVLITAENVPYPKKKKGKENGVGRMG